MSELTLSLAGYYLGLGFVVLLFWAACLPDDAPDNRRIARTARRSTAVAVLGVVHPAVALAARDLIGQARLELDEREADLAPSLDRAAAVASACLALSLVVAAGVLVAAAVV